VISESRVASIKFYLDHIFQWSYSFRLFDEPYLRSCVNHNILIRIIKISIFHCLSDVHIMHNVHAKVLVVLGCSSLIAIVNTLAQAEHLWMSHTDGYIFPYFNISFNVIVISDAQPYIDVVGRHRYATLPVTSFIKIVTVFWRNNHATRQ
jgi:hypothetical protein